MEEKIINWKEVFRGKLLTLKVAEVELANGVVSTREVVQHRGAVAILPILPSGEILLVSQFRLPAGKVLLEIPAGTLDPQEEPLICAQRELEEETGYVAGRWQELASVFLAPGYSTERIHIFLAEELSPGEMSPDQDEILSLKRFPLPQLLKMIEEGEIEDAKTIIALLLYNNLKKEEK